MRLQRQFKRFDSLIFPWTQVGDASIHPAHRTRRLLHWIRDAAAGTRLANWSQDTQVPYKH